MTLEAEKLTTDQEDEAFLQRFVLSEEDRQRQCPATRWAGGYRWFRSCNVIRLELYRTPEDIHRICAVLLGGPRSEVGTPRSKVG